MPPETAQLPVLLVAGYLGAGKTTRINRWLRRAAQSGGPRLAVLVNDFGDLPIDADLIDAQDGGVLNLSGGCLCCSFGDDLVGTLRTLAARADRPELVLIEASGVALPAAVAQTAQLAPEVRWLGNLVLVDAPAVLGQLKHRYVGDTVRQQLMQADGLLPTKLDAPGAPTRAALADSLRAAGSRAPLLDDADDWLVVGNEKGPWALLNAPPASAETVQMAAPHIAATPQTHWEGRPYSQVVSPKFAPYSAGKHPFVAYRMRRLQGRSAEDLAAALGAAGAAVARAKCLGRDPDGRTWVLHLASGQVRVEPARFSGPARGVVIGLRGEDLAQALSDWI